jgi:hypothetical protein
MEKNMKKRRQGRSCRGMKLRLTGSSVFWSSVHLKRKTHQPVP